MSSPLTLLQVFDRLYAAHGPQHWWPGDSAFEVMVGAVLTQNAAWSNVERAIDNLKGAGCLSLDALLTLSESELAELIRPFSMTVLAHDPFVTKEAAGALDVELVELDELLTRSDFVSIHALLSEDTRGLIMNPASV